MPIIGFNFTKIAVERIAVERKDIIGGKIDIKSKIDIADIEKEDLNLTPGKDTVKISFTFEIIYEPNIANINFKGNVLFLEDPKKIKDILKDWKKKKLGDDVREQVYNLILRRCNIKAFSLEEDLNLPTHFPMPRITSEQK